MKKENPLLILIMWLVGILASLAIGFGMIDGVLAVRWLEPMVAIVAGWIIVIGTFLGIAIAVAKYFKLV